MKRAATALRGLSMHLEAVNGLHFFVCCCGLFRWAQDQMVPEEDARDGQNFKAP